MINLYPIESEIAGGFPKKFLLSRYQPDYKLHFTSAMVMVFCIF